MLPPTCPFHPQWGQAVVGYFTGMCGALVAYCVGLHAALLMDR